ncbi:DUF4192 domain-containing protein [Leekyejoonella antrihumi]|uniref:DUF4192 domain-containing protein n=1 Tax=Leekyejoonella antrihumi TaxID=1660198 RepID=A0A563DY67_9MICO|nr:DUF4192 domain-containing protein [Leekyejoonella antrihumi]TWP35200.1 DUF4192 domain-containing protein [Leekyejoonella antrihumi]
MSIVIRSVGQMAAYLPYSLGFYPHRSVVVVGQIGRELGMTARQDIPPPGATDREARQVAALFAREGHDSAQLFGIDDGPDPEPLLRAARRSLSALGIRVSHTALLDGVGNWRALQCACGGCPREWTAVPDVSKNPAVAEAVLRGIAPMDSRADVEALLVPTDPTLLDQVARAIRRGAGPSLTQVGVAVRHLVHEDFSGGSQLSIADLADATSGLQRIAVRDGVLSWLLPQEFPTVAAADRLPDLVVALGRSPGAREHPADFFCDDTGGVASRLAACARSTPRDLRAPVLTVLAAVGWLGGGGALGRTAAEQALEIDPGYRLAQMVHQAFEHCVRPTPREDRHPA